MLPTQAATVIRKSDCQVKSTNANYCVLIVALSFLTIGWKGYRYDTLDQHLTLPVLKKRIDPQLYPRDFLLRQEQNAFSLFDAAMTWPAKLVGIEWTFLGCYLLVTGAMGLLIWRLALALFGDRNEALLAAVAALCLRWDDGGMMALYDSYLAFRTAAIPFTLAAYYLMVRRRIAWAAAMAGAELVLHPLTAVSTVLCLIVVACYYVWRGFCGKRELVLAAATYGAWAGLLLVHVLLRTAGGGDALLKPVSPEWLAIVRARTLYMFYSSWPASALLYVCAFPLVFFAFCLGCPRPRRHVVPMVAVTGGVFLNVCALVFGDLLIVPGIMHLHLETARRVVSLFAVMYLGAGVWRLSAAAWRGATRGERPVIAVCQAAAAVLLLGWIVSDAGTYAHADLKNPDQWPLLIKWALPYVLLSTLLLSPGAKGGAAVGGPAAGLLLIGCVVWAKLLLVAASLGVGVLCWLCWPRRVRAPRVGRALAPALAGAAAVEVGGRVAQDGGQSLWTDWITIPGVAKRGPHQGLTTWIRTQTPVDALFLVPPTERGLRVHGERSLFVTAKDGGPVMYSQSYAEEWQNRMRLVRDYDRFQEPHFLWFAHTHGVDFALVSPWHRLRLPVAFENEQYRVYDLRDAARAKPKT